MTVLELVDEAVESTDCNIRITMPSHSARKVGAAGKD